MSCYFTVSLCSPPTRTLRLRTLTFPFGCVEMSLCFSNRTDDTIWCFAVRMNENALRAGSVSPSMVKHYCKNPPKNETKKTIRQSQRFFSCVVFHFTFYSQPHSETTPDHLQKCTRSTRSTREAFSREPPRVGFVTNTKGT